MRHPRIVAAAGAFLGLLGLAPAGHGQSLPPQPVPRPPDLRFTIEQGAPGADSRGLRKDDLREVPAPRVDRLPENVTVNVTVGDPTCLPGEQSYVVPSRPGRRNSSR